MPDQNYDYGNNAAEVLAALARGDLSALEAQRIITNNEANDPLIIKGLNRMNGGSGWYLNEAQTNYLNNMIATEAANSANAFTERMRNTDLLAAGMQLNRMGLASSGVLQTGGSTGPAGAVADTTKFNAAAQSADRAVSMAKSVLSLAGGMAAAGIYGSALASVKGNAAKIAANAAHSAENVDYKRMIYEQALASSKWNMAQDQIDGIMSRYGK